MVGADHENRGQWNIFQGTRGDVRYERWQASGFGETEKRLEVDSVFLNRRLGD